MKKNPDVLMVRITHGPKVRFQSLVRTQDSNVRKLRNDILNIKMQAVLYFIEDFQKVGLSIAWWNDGATERKVSQA